MKKRILAVTLMSILTVMSLTACGSAGSAAAAGSGDTAELKMATGGTTGTYYSYSGVVAQAVSEQLDNVNITVHSSGASKANIFEIADGEADMAIVQNDVAYYAYNGTDLFEEDGAVTDFSVLGAAYAEVCQVVASTDISSIADLKGKVVSVGDAGSGCEFNAHQILEAYGMTFDDITVQNLSFGDSSEALKDGKIDAFFCVAGAPTTAIVELATTNDIHILNVDADQLAALKDKYPFYTEYVIPAGTYKGVDEDTTSVAVKATFIVSNELSEDVVYDITKFIYENSDKIVHDKATELSKEYAVDGISIPFHPGAEKYFKEVGAIQ
ncbi:MAG: TAXI family TRAP transporter solute-binding subunit [Lachnospiraceae bacterium]|nr:TAXI family TRAP transporter solute-binding subunit [Lachnospiraceae bacterium]